MLFPGAERIMLHFVGARRFYCTFVEPRLSWVHTAFVTLKLTVSLAFF